MNKTFLQIAKERSYKPLNQFGMFALERGVKQGYLFLPYVSSFVSKYFHLQFAITPLSKE